MANKVTSGGYTYYLDSQGNYWATEAEANESDRGLKQSPDELILPNSPTGQGRPTRDLREGASTPSPTYKDTRTAEQKAKDAFESGNIGGAGGAYNAGNDATRAAFDATHRTNNSSGRKTWRNSTLADIAEFAVNPIGQGAETLGLPPWAVTAANFTSPYGMAENGYGAAKWVADESSYEPTMNGSRGGAAGGGGLGSGNYDVLDPTARPENVPRDNALDGAMEDPNKSWIYDIYNQGRDITSSQNEQELADARANRARGLQLNTDLLSKLMSYNPELEAEMASDRALADQFTFANSARGGAGARASALYEAQSMAPELQARAMEQAVQTENTRLGQAAQVAGTIGQLSSTEFGQEADYDVADRNIGLGVYNGLVNMGANGANIDQKQRENLGRIANDLNQTDVQWQQMSSNEKMAAWNEMVNLYNIDERTRVELERIAAENKVTPLDIIEIGLQAAVTAKKVGAF